MKYQIYLLLSMLLFTSCQAYRDVVYFKDLDGKEIKGQPIKNYVPLKISKDDLLAISISSLEPKAAEVYNLGLGTGGVENSANSGYLVDQSGFIQIPTFGSIYVEGLTTIEAKDLIKSKLTPFLGNTVVNLRLINFKISILGDVASPGVYNFKEEKVSLIQAISQAGDLGITGYRNNVLLIRENQNNRDFIRLNLNQKDIFNSPYYYLEPNDVIYVQARNTKYANVDNNYRYVGLISSGLSVILIIITLFK